MCPAFTHTTQQRLSAGDDGLAGVFWVHHVAVPSSAVCYGLVQPRLQVLVHTLRVHTACYAKVQRCQGHIQYVDDAVLQLQL